jgi:hypothetical protein
MQNVINLPPNKKPESLTVHILTSEWKTQPKTFRMQTIDANLQMKNFINLNANLQMKTEFFFRVVEFAALIAGKKVLLFDLCFCHWRICEWRICEWRICEWRNVTWRDVTRLNVTFERFHRRKINPTNTAREK